jgi:hypothetical protein
MFKKENIIIAGVIISLILGVVGLVGDTKQSNLGGITNYDAIGVDCIQLNSGSEALYMSTTSTGTAVWVAGSCN